MTDKWGGATFNGIEGDIDPKERQRLKDSFTEYFPKLAGFIEEGTENDVDD